MGLKLTGVLGLKLILLAQQLLLLAFEFGQLLLRRRNLAGQGVELALNLHLTLLAVNRA